MARRCGYCTRRLGRLASLLRFYACKGCASRLSMGGTPLKPPSEGENPSA